MTLDCGRHSIFTAADAPSKSKRKLLLLPLLTKATIQVSSVVSASPSVSLAASIFISRQPLEIENFAVFLFQAN